MHKKECLGRTGRFTSEYRSTYTLSWRYEMPSGEVYYFTQEAYDDAFSTDKVRKGHCVREWTNMGSLSRMAGTISGSERVLLQSAISRGTLEPFHTIVVMEYEVDYE